MKMGLGKGMCWSKLGLGFENLFARPHREFLVVRIPLLWKILKPIHFEKLSSDENKIIIIIIIQLIHIAHIRRLYALYSVVHRNK